MGQSPSSDVVSERARSMKLMCLLDITHVKFINPGNSPGFESVYRNGSRSLSFCCLSSIPSLFVQCGITSLSPYRYVVLFLFLSWSLSLSSHSYHMKSYKH